MLMIDRNSINLKNIRISLLKYLILVNINFRQYTIILQKIPRFIVIYLL